MRKCDVSYKQAKMIATQARENLGMADRSMLWSKDLETECLRIHQLEQAKTEVAISTPPVTAISASSKDTKPRAVKRCSLTSHTTESTTESSRDEPTWTPFSSKVETEKSSRKSPLPSEFAVPQSPLQKTSAIRPFKTLSSDHFLSEATTGMDGSKHRRGKRHTGESKTNIDGSNHRGRNHDTGDEQNHQQRTRSKSRVRTRRFSCNETDKVDPLALSSSTPDRSSSRAKSPPKRNDPRPLSPSRQSPTRQQSPERRSLSPKKNSDLNHHASPLQRTLERNSKSPQKCKDELLSILPSQYFMEESKNDPPKSPTRSHDPYMPLSDSEHSKQSRRGRERSKNQHANTETDNDRTRDHSVSKHKGSDKHVASLSSSDHQSDKKEESKSRSRHRRSILLSDTAKDEEVKDKRGRSVSRKKNSNEHIELTTRQDSAHHRSKSTHKRSDPLLSLSASSEHSTNAPKDEPRQSKSMHKRSDPFISLSISDHDETKIESHRRRSKSTHKRSDPFVSLSASDHDATTKESERRRSRSKSTHRRSDPFVSLSASDQDATTKESERRHSKSAHKKSDPFILLSSSDHDATKKDSERRHSKSAHNPSDRGRSVSRHKRIDPLSVSDHSVETKQKTKRGSKHTSKTLRRLSTSEIEALAKDNPGALQSLLGKSSKDQSPRPVLYGNSKDSDDEESNDDFLEVIRLRSSKISSDSAGFPRGNSSSRNKLDSQNVSDEESIDFSDFDTKVKYSSPENSKASLGGSKTRMLPVINTSPNKVGAAASTSRLNSSDVVLRSPNSSLRRSRILAAAPRIFDNNPTTPSRVSNTVHVPMHNMNNDSFIKLDLQKRDSNETLSSIDYSLPSKPIEKLSGTSRTDEDSNTSGDDKMGNARRSSTRNSSSSHMMNASIRDFALEQERKSKMKLRLPKRQPSLERKKVGRNNSNDSLRSNSSNERKAIKVPHKTKLKKERSFGKAIKFWH
jgi:hypothetical protein